MHQVKKETTWHFSCKPHIGVDKDTGLVHSVEVAAANVHDVTMTTKLLTGDEGNIYGNSGYLGTNKREDAFRMNSQSKRIRYRINRRPSQIRETPVRTQGQFKR